MAMQIKYIINIRTVSETNIRGHWAKHAPLHKEQNALAGIMTRRAMGRLPLTHELHQPEAPINITLIRHGPKEMDSDNLPAALKHIRDGIADALAPGLCPGRADGLPRFSWTYRQKKAKAKDARIEVTLEKYDPMAYLPDKATNRLHLPPTPIGSFGGPWNGD